MWDQPVRFAPTTAVYYESGSYIVHNYAIHSWIVVSRDDYAVISGLQYQRMTPNEAVSWLVSHRGLSAAEARRKVGRLILLLRANKIAALPGEPFAEPPGEVKRTVPNVVYFVATYRCNLACAYCYAESSPQAETAGDLTTAEAMAMIDQVADLGVKAMAFTGGEALMRRDCIDLIEHAKARGLQVSLITNGGPVTPEKAQRLARSLTSVTVSMDSPCAEGGHDAMRGAGSWERANRAIALFREAGIPVDVNTTVTAASVGHLPGMVSWALDHGIRSHRIGFVSELGRGESGMAASAPDRIRAERESLRILVERIDEVNLRGLRFLHNPPPPFILKRHCGVGTEEISIDCKGDVYPCKLLHDPQFRAGNIREKPLREIWETSEVLKAMLGVNPDNLPGCRDCTFRYVCGGGCRAHQMAMTGDLYGTYDPDCPSLRRSLRRHMWLTYKQHEARMAQTGGE